MVLSDRQRAVMETMPQTVPSAGFTPPCDYTNFAENFDLSLLPGGDQPLSPSGPPYCAEHNKSALIQPRIFTTYYPSSPESHSDGDFAPEFQPDFQKLLGDDSNKYLSPRSPIHLEVPQPSPLGSLSPYSPNSQGLLSPKDPFATYRDQGSFYPSSPEYSLYAGSPSSVYSKSPCDEYAFIKTEVLRSASTSPLPNLSPFGIKEESFLPVSPAASSYSHNDSQNDVASTGLLFDPQKRIKQESTVDFSELFDDIERTETLKGLLNQKPQTVPDASKDHQLLRQFLRDTSFQKKFNIHPIDFAFVNGDIKMEQQHQQQPSTSEQSDLMMGCDEQISRESIEPVLNMAIEQMRKDVDDTCSMLGISSDPAGWSAADVLSWLRWTTRQFNCPEPVSERWDMSGADLLALDEKQFSDRAPEGGVILHAQLEIWKAACSEESLKNNWLPPTENVSSNASSGDVSDDEDEEMHPATDPTKPTTSTRTGSHIHLWQFLKELLASPQTHGSCIRWLDRGKGIFKIEDSVKVARLWGKRKNRPAMNYDKLSRSIRQYYKKGIMKKTERSQRLVYQFCHPYNL